MPESGVPHERQPVLFVTWSFVQGRSLEIATELGGTVSAIHPGRLSSGRLAPLRYVVSAALTLRSLLGRRPRSVIVTNPPIFPAMICWAWCAVTGAAFVLDSHPGSFGRKENRVAQFFMPVHRWLAARAAGVLVTTEHWVEVVDGWGGRGVVVHEAPPTWEVPAPEPLGPRPRVLFVGIFANDEPVVDVVGAAGAVEDIDLEITGDTTRAPAGLVKAAPSNVTFVGYLGPQDYRDAVERADIIMALTTEPTSVMRAAYEAVYARRPLVISDWPDLRELFPDAVLVGNERAELERGLREAVSRHEELRERAGRARDAQLRRWSDQLEQIRSLLASPRPTPRDRVGDGGRAT